MSVPNTIDPTHLTGRAGSRNYEGSVAWYRTSFPAPRAGTYALSFASANFQANVWVDGQAIGSHEGSYLPFEGRAQLAAGTHTVVVRVDWRDPAAQSRQGFHRTWFNWGGLDGEVSVRAIGESELIEPTVQTTLEPDCAGHRAGGGAGAQRRAIPHDRPAGDAHKRGTDDPPGLPRPGGRARADGEHEHDRDRRETRHSGRPATRTCTPSISRSVRRAASPRASACAS